MSKVNKLGIWMDHSEAHLIEFSSEAASVIIHNTLGHDGIEAATSKGENLMHNKEQQHQASFYKKLEAAILNYSEVLLFGPTNAKTELHNLLQADHKFDNIKMEVQTADKMTENQKVAFVKSHFEKK